MRLSRRNLLRGVLGVGAVSALGLVAAACGAPATAPTPAPQATSAKRVTIGYAAPSLIGGQVDIQRSLVDHAQKKGWAVITTNADGDPKKQLDQIDYFITLGVDAIVCVPEDSYGICVAVGKARAAKIPFYTIDRGTIGCKVDMSVLSDNYLGGQQAALAMVDLLKQRYGSAKGKVLEITGKLGEDVTQLRGKGFDDVMKQNPGIDLIIKPGDWDANKGQAIVRDILSANPDLDGIYMHSDAVYMPGTLAVLKQLNRLLKRGEKGHVFLTAVDGSAIGLQAIRDGWADACAAQPVPDFGIIVDWIEKQLKGEKIEIGKVVREGALWSPAEIRQTDSGLQLLLATTLVTAENVDDPRLWGNQKSG